MLTIDRRSFIAALATVAGAAQLGLPAPALAAGGPVGFPEASSNPLRWPFVMGLLVVASPAGPESEIAALRDKTSYHRGLAYSSSDRKKQAFAEALIGWFLGNPDVSFAALVVTDPNVKWPEKNDARDVVLAGFCKQLLATAGSPAGLSINIPDKRRAPRDRAMRALVPAPEGGTPDMPNLDQTARFLTGCLYGEATGAKQPLKAQLIGALKAKLKVEALAGAKVAGKFAALPVTL